MPAHPYRPAGKKHKIAPRLQVLNELLRADTALTAAEVLTRLTDQGCITSYRTVYRAIEEITTAFADQFVITETIKHAGKSRVSAWEVRLPGNRPASWPPVVPGAGQYRRR